MSNRFETLRQNPRKIRRVAIASAAALAVGLSAAGPVIAFGGSDRDDDREDRREAIMEAVYQQADSLAVSMLQATESAQAMDAGVVTAVRLGPAPDQRAAIRDALKDDDDEKTLANLPLSWLVHVTDANGTSSLVVVDATSGEAALADPFLSGMMGKGPGGKKGSMTQPQASADGANQGNALAAALASVSVPLTDALATAQATGGEGFKITGFKGVISGGEPGWVISGLAPEEPGDDDDLDRIAVAVSGQSGEAALVPPSYGRHGWGGHGWGSHGGGLYGSSKHGANQGWSDGNGTR
ncbi:MAG: hypothetical protein ACPGOY_06255 [Rhodospirillaceae bacterium]